MPLYDATALELALDFVVGTYQELLVNERAWKDLGWPDDHPAVVNTRLINDHIIAFATKAKVLDRLDLEAKGIVRPNPAVLDLAALFGKG